MLKGILGGVWAEKIIVAPIVIEVINRLNNFLYA